jgi:hypothetical protein
MTRWQYAWLRDEPQMAVFFSHPQGPNLVNELTTVIGPSLIIPQSSEWVLSLNKQTLNVPYFCGLLGDRGWELVSVETRIAGPMSMPSTTMYFKRPVEA